MLSLVDPSNENGVAPSISAVTVKVSVAALPIVVLPVDVRSVNVPAAADDPPIIVPSSVPPFISTVVTVPRSVQVAPAAVGDVVIVGEVILGALLKTTTPPDDPVSSESDDARTDDTADVVIFDEESRNSALDAVRLAKLIVAAVTVTVLLPKAIVVSTPAEASKVQVTPEPEPNVVVPISVVSRFSVTVSVAPATVSIPLVPPAISIVFPEVKVWSVPESPESVNEVAPPEVAQSQVAVAETHPNVSPSAHPRNSVTPDENSSPEAEDVVVLVPDVVRATASEASPDVAPPVKPFPAVTPVMSPLVLELEELEDVEEIVIVEPDVEIEVPPDPCIVKAPETSLTVDTIPSAESETTGFCPPVTLIPVPPVTE